MTESVAKSRSWGIGFILVAALLAILGQVGSWWMSELDSSRRAELGNRENREHKAVWDDHWSRLKTSVQGLGALEFATRGETATGPDFIVPAPLDSVLKAAVRAAYDELATRYPGRQNLVIVDMGLGELSGREYMRLPNRWIAAPEDLQAQVEQHPASDEIRRNSIEGRSSRLSVVLSVVRGKTGSTDYDILGRYFPGSSMTTLDVAGNRYPVGVPGRIRMEFFQLVEPEWYATKTVYGLFSTILTRLSQIGIILLFILPPVWVYVDARVRRQPAVLWLLFTIPTSVLGALVYALVNRDAGPACPECGERVSSRFVVCPYCQTELKGTCSNCGQTVGRNWSYCPSCATEL